MDKKTDKEIYNEIKKEFFDTMDKYLSGKYADCYMKLNYNDKKIIEKNGSLKDIVDSYFGEGFYNSTNGRFYYGRWTLYDVGNCECINFPFDLVDEVNYYKKNKEHFKKKSQLTSLIENFDILWNKYKNEYNFKKNENNVNPELLITQINKIADLNKLLENEKIEESEYIFD